MIRINLLPVRAAKKRELGKVQLAIGLMVAGAAVAGNWYWTGLEAQDVERLKRQVADTKREITQLEKIIGEVKDIQARKEDLTRKLGVLDKLKKGKTGPVKVLDELAKLMPKQVWISQFAEKEGNLTMKGQSIKLEDLSAFMAALNQSPFFEKVELEGATSKKGDTQEIVDFTLTGRVVYTAG